MIREKLSKLMKGGKKKMARIPAKDYQTDEERIAELEKDIAKYKEAKDKDKSEADVIKEAVTDTAPDATPRKIVVVKELPTQPVREVEDEQGNKLSLITIEEYLTEQANK